MPTINVNDEAFLYAIQLCNPHVFPMVFQAAIDLDLFETIAKIDNGTASTIAAQLPMFDKDKAAPDSNLDRMLHFLSCHSILTCTLHTLGDGTIEKCYSLSPAGKFFVRDADGVSLATVYNFTTQSTIVEIWHHMKDAVLRGGIPFERAHGMPLYEYMKNDPNFREKFHDAMTTISNISLKNALQVYNGFEGLKSLVDVGGGSGTTLNMILSKHPSIVGINFDLPDTLAKAPVYPGIKNVAGDMFEGVPTADAILLKCILHNWNDEHSLKILKNCYKALPEGGKVIINDMVFPVVPESTIIGKDLALRDNMMYNYFEAKERTELEFKALAKEAGFSSFEIVCCTDGHSILELHK